MSTNPILSSIEIRDIEADWDDEGIFVYQAYNQEIAQWALQHQKLGGPAFKQGTRHQKSTYQTYFHLVLCSFAQTFAQAF